MVAMSDVNDTSVTTSPLLLSSNGGGSASPTKLSSSTESGRQSMGSSSDALPFPSSITASFSESTSAPSTPSSTPSTTPSGTPPSSPPTKDGPTTKKASKLPTKCPLEKCLLCTREQPLCLMRSSTWPAIMRVVFFTLKFNYPEKEFFNLKDDVYSVMLFHWNKLAIHKKGAANWKKHIQDMLSHSKDIFESGLEIYGQNGYWRLKTNTDPWTLSGKTRRVPKKGLAQKRPLDEMPAAEQVPRRPFIPYIAKEQPNKYTENYTQPVNYVFINEQSSNPNPSVIQSTQPPQREPTPNPFTQRFSPYPTTSHPIVTPLPPQSIFTQSSPPYPTPSQLQHQAYINSRMAISLPTSRLPSPQRSRSPSPHTQSLPTSPRNPLLPPFSPYSAPASPSSRAAPYPHPSSRQSPRSQPVSPHGSPPASPRPRDRAIRALRSPPSPQSPRNYAQSQDESALDSLRTTFEQFHWPTTPGGHMPPSHGKMTGHLPPQQSHSNAQGQSQYAHAHAQQQQQQQQQHNTPSHEPAHHVAFNLFASAKPANPCDVQFLLNE